MCARYTETTPLAELAARFGCEPPDEQAARQAHPRFNLAPSQDAPVVVVRPAPARGADGERGPPGEGGGRDQDRHRALRMMRWGLVPSSAQDPETAKPLINARGETLDRLPSFRDAFRRRRCLVPADGFYEWRPGREGRRAVKIPLLFRRKDRAAFAFAGLWAQWWLPGGALDTFAIVTCEPNAVVRAIHDRMPAILRAEDEAAWLDPGTAPDRLHAALAPYPADLMEAFEVSRLVNKTDNDSAACIQPAPRLFS